MRSNGSPFGSGWPSVASHMAVWRPTSQLTGPWRLNIRARSPNIGRPSNGVPLSGPEVLTSGSYALARCLRARGALGDGDLHAAVLAVPDDVEGDDVAGAVGAHGHGQHAER